MTDDDGKMYYMNKWLDAKDIVCARNAEIIALKQERDELMAELHGYRYAVQHVTEDGKTIRSYTDGDWSMVNSGRLVDLEIVEEKYSVYVAQLKAADALAEAVHNYIAWKDALLADDDYIMRRFLHLYKEARRAG